MVVVGKGSLDALGISITTSQRRIIAGSWALGPSFECVICRVYELVDRLYCSQLSDDVIVNMWRAEDQHLESLFYGCVFVLLLFCCAISLSTLPNGNPWMFFFVSRFDSC